MSGPPQGGDGSDIEDVDEDIAEDEEGMPEEVARDLETMVSESDACMIYL